MTIHNRLFDAEGAMQPMRATRVNGPDRVSGDKALVNHERPTFAVDDDHLHVGGGANADGGSKRTMTSSRKPSLTRRTIDYLEVAIAELRLAAADEEDPVRSAALLNSITFLRRLIDAKLAGDE